MMLNREVPRLTDEGGDLALSAAPYACAVNMQNSDRFSHDSPEGQSSLINGAYFTLIVGEKAWARSSLLWNMAGNFYLKRAVIALVDDEKGFQVANKINRFAIGDRDGLKYNNDGSLDLYIQTDSPGADKESNQLPSPPKGKLGVTMRLYAPKSSAIDGRWNPTFVRRVGNF